MKLSESGNLTLGGRSAGAGESVSAGPAGSETASIHFKGLLALVFTFAVLIAIWAYLNGGGQKAQPRYELGNPKEGEKYAGLNKLVAIAGDLVGDQSTGHEWRQPDWDTAGNVYLPHRYPAVAGTNISTLIHRGFDSWMVPAPQDADWIEHPPTGAMW